MPLKAVTISPMSFTYLSFEIGFFGVLCVFSADFPVLLSLPPFYPVFDFIPLVLSNVLSLSCVLTFSSGSSRIPFSANESFLPSFLTAAEAALSFLFVADFFKELFWRLAATPPSLAADFYLLNELFAEEAFAMPLVRLSAAFLAFSLAWRARSSRIMYI